MLQIRKELLNNQQTLIEYFIGKNKIYLIKITKEELSLIEKEKTEDLQKWINTLLDNRKLEGKNSLIAFTDSAHALFEFLIRPLNIKPSQDLIIIPDGILGYLPFEILVKQKEEYLLPKKTFFLLHYHMISYAYSATLLHLQNNSTSPNTKTLGVFPIFENSDRYLSHSEKEIESLKNLGAVVLKNKAANSVNVLDTLSSFDLIHLSTHAVAEDSLLQQPAIYFRIVLFIYQIFIP